MSISAILLAGGRASRLDGATKPLFTRDGHTLLDRAIGAVRGVGCELITVVGPELSTPERAGIAWVREDPPFTGPAAATVAALATGTMDSEWTLILACDLLRPDVAGVMLAEAVALLPHDTDGVCLGDSASRPQWMIGAYRTRALVRAASAMPDAGRNASMRALLDDLAIAVIAAPDHVVADVDTWQDVETAHLQLPTREDPS
ncbi:molybdopterin-guanine dinucleotide biosynthesis protein A [Microbacterium endophyticum]|uniref:Molybdopterin-guanine dinucleotide biosynthesis protein A n=1 Tax=Microbacterium endophyticum TaxID=1526412 RepID=A0A7W4V5C5_9MICO|nr:NTP transferase domain-containing protein [Microbacterium endophyticum]MBB2976580.1 molybdopterin-guanine dinucleotide biosynthesis protein A [Microbacterium endophyticum]NIK37537.1 molybdopterin-guanine dinucleotide biosynthesis protein A [Microbacterium endophyticum]